MKRFFMDSFHLINKEITALKYRHSVIPSKFIDLVGITHQWSLKSQKDKQSDTIHLLMQVKTTSAPGKHFCPKPKNII